jgi:hypothetical protein
MAVRGDFKLNSVWYKAANGSLPNQQLANQMAQKIGQGTSKYGDLTTWSAWVQDNWQDGSGKLEPGVNGGFLYGEVESRVPRQLILPQALQIYGKVQRTTTSGDYKGWSYSPGQLTSATTRATYSLANNLYLAWQINTDATGGEPRTYDFFNLWIYGECADATVLRADLYSTTATDPNASIANASATITNDFPGPHWHKIALATTAQPDETDYFVVLRPTTGSITLHGTSNLSPAPVVRSSSNGTAWSSVTTFQPFFLLDVEAAGAAIDIDDTADNIIKIVYSTHANGVAFIGALENSPTFAYAFGRSASGSFLEVKCGWSDGSTANVAPTDAAVFNNLIYVGRGGTTDYLTYFPLDLGAGANDIDNVFADKLLSFGGYLWRTIGTDLYYSADVSTWTTVGQVCGDPWSIRSMAGLEGSVYCACDDGLYRIAPGDFVEGVAPWQPNSLNGRSMVSYNGSLYIVVNGRVTRYSADGSMQDVWMSRDDDLPATRMGEVVSVAVTDLGLVALVKSTTGRCSVWAMQDQSWHHLTTLPSTTAATMYYERSTYKLWVGTSDGYAFGVYLPSNALNPYNDTASLYMPAAWVEWDWFDGSVLEAQKDYESVTILGENFAAGQYVKVYWKDDASTAWELLGTCDANNEELIWTDLSTRPNTKRLKLGLLLYTTSAAETPRIQAIRVKYHLMTADWFRWSLAVDVSGRSGSTQQMAEDVNTLTASQIKTNLDALAAQVPPFAYQDVDENIYLVKINDANFTYTKYEYIEHTSTMYWEGVYRLVLEQVRPGEYTP